MKGGKGSSRVSVKFYYDTLLEVFNEYKKVYDRNGFIPPTVVSVDRRPATTATLPDPEVVYYMAETDTVGGRTINQGTYVKYDNVNKNIQRYDIRSY